MQKINIEFSKKTAKGGNFMNRELRKMCNAVNEYVVLLQQPTPDVKQNPTQYLSDIENLNGIISSYLGKTVDVFQVWCDESVRVFSQESTNVFLRIKRYFSMKIINHYLNKYSFEMSVCGYLQNNLSFIEQRLIQYEILN